MRDYTHLVVWEKAHRLAVDVHSAMAHAPPQTPPGLKSQIVRAAMSIPANIAEGCGKRGNRELARYADIARGSANELKYHLLLARDLGSLAYRHHADLSARADEVCRMLYGLAAAVRRAGTSGDKS